MQLQIKWKIGYLHLAKMNSSTELSVKRSKFNWANWREGEKRMILCWPYAESDVTKHNMLPVDFSIQPSTKPAHIVYRCVPLLDFIFILYFKFRAWFAVYCFLKPHFKHICLNLLSISRTHQSGFKPCLEQGTRKIQSYCLNTDIFITS